MTQRFFYTVYVDCDQRGQADQVMAERLEHEEDYGFDYTIGYSADPRLSSVVKGQLYEYIGGAGTNPALEIRHIRIKRVARDAAWADIQVTQPATGNTWAKRQPLVNGHLGYPTRLIGSI